MEMNISELCSSFESDSLTQSVISVQDDEEEEEDSGKCAASQQSIFVHNTPPIGIFADCTVNGDTSVNSNSISVES